MEMASMTLTSTPTLPGVDVIDWDAIGPWTIETPTDSAEGQADLAELRGVPVVAVDNEAQKLSFRWAICELTAGNFDRIAGEFTAEECRELVARYSRYEAINNAWMDAAGLGHDPKNDIYHAKVIPALRRRLAKLERPPIPSRPIAGETRIERIKRLVSVESLASQYTTLKPAGLGKEKGRCPLHEERTASFYVYIESQRWHCFGACAIGGDVIDLAEQLMARGRL
jgi:hypothetical protein